MRVGSLYLQIGLLTLVSASCSRSATCAFEGCASEDSVEFATDGAEYKTDDVKAEKNYSKEFISIFKRLNLIEELNKLQDKNIGLLSARVDVVELNLKKAESSISAHEAAIAENTLAIKDVRDALNADILSRAESNEMLAMQIQAINSQITNLWNSVSELSANDDALRVDLMDQIDALNAQFSSKVEELELNDASLLKKYNDLSAKQIKTAKQLARLKKNFNQFKKEQEFFQFIVQMQMKFLYEKINNVKERLENKIERQAEKHQILKGLVRDLADQVGELTNEVAGIKDELKDLENNMEDELQDLDKRMDKLSDKNKSLEGDMDKLSKKVEKLNDAMDDVDSCTLSSPYYTGPKGGKKYVVLLTCGNVSEELLVKD